MSSVIKAHDPARSLSAVAFNLDDVAANARDYLEQVRLQAAKLVAQAEADAAAIRAKAEAEGVAAAKSRVDEMVEQRVAQRLQSASASLDQVVAQIEQSRHSWMRRWESSAIDLAARMAERILRRELDREPQLAEATIREALELSAGSGEIRLLLHPDDHASLGRFVDELSRRSARLAPTEIVADPAVSRGGCRVETRFGVIDATIEAQLARLVEELQ